MLLDRVVRMELSIPLERMDLVALAHEQGKVLAEDYERGVADIQCVVPRPLESRFAPFLRRGKKPGKSDKRLTK
jgi:GTP-binding protein HflX